MVGLDRVWRSVARTVGMLVLVPVVGLTLLALPFVWLWREVAGC
jgi:hypothetical protein